MQSHLHDTLDAIDLASDEPAMSSSFFPSERTRLRRKPGRGSCDEDKIFGILDAGLVCHVGYAIDGQAYVTPTAYWRHGHRLFWHGSAASRMIKAQARGLPVCVTVTHIDGFVVARSGFTTSLQYRSVMAFGRTSLIDDPEAKRSAMHAFIDRLFPGRWGVLRPIRQSELDAVSLIAMTIDEASAKFRADGVLDREEDLAFPCWAGVIPIRTTIGRIVPDARLAVDAAIPENLAIYAEGAPLDDVLVALARASAQAERQPEPTPFPRPASGQSEAQ
jgi:nitroimidazol reductase NimA-like FMN-containing flavoprotein (pyridoxamine 5'-phosphate oxidase superfamily)